MKRICMMVTSEYDQDPRPQKEARLAHEHGYEVTVICRSYAGASKGYQIIPLNIGRQRRKLDKILERTWMNLKFIWHAVRLHPHIIHCNDLDTLPAGYLAAKISGAKLLYDAHELWTEMVSNVGTGGRAVARAVEKFLSRRADAVVAVSKYRAEIMAKELGIPMPVVAMNSPYYVPYDCLTARNWLQPFSGRKIVLYQGRFRESMGLQKAILSATYLSPDVILVFRGMGPYENEMRRIISENYLQDRVFMLPPVPMSEMVFTAFGADLGLIVYEPVTRNDLYAAPNKLFEYMMAGVPCVGSDLPYIREVIVENQLGDVFNPGDSQDLARVISCLLSDPEKMDVMKKNCIRIAPQFSWEVEGKKILMEYQRISP